MSRLAPETYRGTALSESISVTEIYTVLSPDLTLHYPGHGESHPFPEIIALTKGEHTLLIDKERYTLREGQMLIYAPGAFHESSDVRPTRAEAQILTFACASARLFSLCNRVITLTPAQRTALDAIISQGVQCFKGRAPDDTVRGMVLCEGVTEDTLSRLRKQIELFLIDVAECNATERTKKEVRRDAELAAVTDFLSRNVSSPLTLSQIALGCSMSVSKLKLLFRERLGSGPIDYLIRLRIDRARELIRTGEYTLTEIAERVGFSSLHYFSRAFKRITGLSPSEYAKTHR
jgi:AraC-like DNA-binding protein